MNYTYILRRILLFIPTLFAISLIAFIISINAPGDPVEAFFEGGRSGRAGTEPGNKIENEKKALRHKLGLDLPVFYFTMTSLATPDTLYKIGHVGERENLERLIERFGCWEPISIYYQDLNQLKVVAGSVLPDSLCADVGTERDQIYEKVLSLLLTDDQAEITSKLNSIKQELAVTPELSYMTASVLQCESDLSVIEKESSSWKNYIPVFHFYGNNQYHRWLFGDGNMFTGSGSENSKGVIRGDFGKSYANGLPVTETISRALPWSVAFTLISVILAYLISIPIGVQAAAKRGSLFDRASSTVLFMLYSLPPFLMGIVLLVLLANPDMWNIFPANGIEPTTGIDPDLSWWDRLLIRLPYFKLPLICYTYSSLAFLSRTVRSSMLEVNTMDFMRTARAKGLTDLQLNYKHGLRNALLPIITVFANVLPAAIGGSVILEYLFGIPGMGPQILGAVQAKDFSMIVAVFTLSGFMTITGHLIADILYSVADPRISFDKK